MSTLATDLTIADVDQHLAEWAECLRRANTVKQLTNSRSAIDAWLDLRLDLDREG